MNGLLAILIFIGVWVIIRVVVEFIKTTVKSIDHKQYVNHHKELKRRGLE